ncbi:MULTISPECIES: transposase family protein [unclassified Actinopolyspora]|uniref:transposase family protein n=1 Tax=unclassified Actinopolyspora TaxID=2639451 RepID=UPI0013F67779|nr:MULTISPECIES: transposase family protein [unclassified Actinopolyspora]NHD16345.1 transposase [Actinopolyspora sp. BKK2]NHE75792.1 transposase [Actinopolyspora sp. BKK1]
MRYEDTTGLSEDQLCWLTERISEVIRWNSRNTLSVFMALVVTLESYRTNLTQKQLAAFRNTSQSTVSRVLRRIEPALAEVVDEIHAPLEEFHGRVALVDGVLIPTGNRRDQERLYSGKHRRYGVRLQLTTDLNGSLIACSEIFPGATHDLTVFRNSSLHETLNHANTIGDLDYLGSAITKPHKTPKNGTLDPDREKSNTTVAFLLYPIERTIAHLKN